MAGMIHETAHEWTATVQQIIAPHLHQVPYGNLRTEFSHWQETDGTVENLAIVYEVPGGSTNQLNITCHAATGVYRYIGLDAHEEQSTASLADVLQMIRDAVERIPAIRRHRLREDIDRWAAQGLTQRDLFQKMNGLLQVSDLRGGAITMVEMKFGITHILANYRVATV